MVSLFNVAVAFATISFTSGLLLSTNNHLKSSEAEVQSPTCSQTQCEVCLACVGDDCAGVLQYTADMAGQCDVCEAHLQNTCWTDGLDASTGEYFKIIHDTGEVYNKTTCVKYESMDANESQYWDPNTQEEVSARYAAKSYFEAACSTSQTGIRKTCAENHCEKMCEQKCVDPKGGTLGGMSIGCMLKMQACYDSHAACLMDSVCRNGWVCESWKDENCPWPGDDESLFLLGHHVTKQEVNVTALYEERRHKLKDDAQAIAKKDASLHRQNDKDWVEMKKRAATDAALTRRLDSSVTQKCSDGV